MKTAVKKTRRAAQKVVQENKWLCKHCHYADNPDRSRICEDCGRPSGRKKGQRHLPGDTVAINKELYSSARDGDDYSCRSCGSVNEHVRRTCRSCGAITPLSERKPPKAKPGTPDYDAFAPAFDERGREILEGVNFWKDATPHIRHYTGLWAISGGLLFVGLMLFMFYSTSTTTMVVDEQTWEHTDVLQELRNLDLEGFEDPSRHQKDDLYRHPSPPNVISIKDDIIGYRDVTEQRTYYGVTDTYEGPEYFCGYSYDYNGDQYEDYCTDTIEEYDDVCCETVKIGEEAIWAPYYVYTIDRWIDIRDLVERGDRSERNQPTCPTVDLRANQRLTECQKTFYLGLQAQDGNDSEEFDKISEDIWLSVRPGSEVLITKNRFGQIKGINWSP